MSDLDYIKLDTSTTENPLPSRRKQPSPVPIPEVGGYPAKVANTQTMKTRGTGAATKGTNSSTRMA